MLGFLKHISLYQDNLKVRGEGGGEGRKWH